jgi:hypothetical protein
MSTSPFSNTIYKIHSSVTKDGDLFIFLVNMKQPFSTQIVRSLHDKNPVFIFEKKLPTKFVNDLNLYTYPLSPLFENKEMYTHTNYILCQICEENDVKITDITKERYKTIKTEISIEYKNNIVKELDHFIKIMQHYSMNIIPLIDLHLEFYNPVDKRFLCC